MASFRTDLYAGLGSAITSSVYYVPDAEELTAFLDVDSATTFIIQGSNADGVRSAIVEDEWSTLTTMAVISTNQLVNIEPGFRWIRGLRETASTASLASFVIAGRNDNGSR